MSSWGIREVAEKCGLTEHTLRWYERIGLLDRIERGADGQRRFGPRAALVEQQECLQMLDAKIRTYRRAVRPAAKETP